MTSPTADLSTDDVRNRWNFHWTSVIERVTHGVGYGLLLPEHLTGKTGLQLIENMTDGKVPVALISFTDRFCIVGSELGHVQIIAKPTERHLNPMGAVHGGWMSTVLDSAAGSAVLSTLPEGYSYTTTELQVDFHKALKADEIVRVTGVVHSARDVTLERGRVTRIAFAEIIGPDGIVYADATAKVRVFRTA